MIDTVVVGLVDDEVPFVVHYALGEARCRIPVPPSGDIKRLPDGDVTPLAERTERCPHRTRLLVGAAFTCPHHVRFACAVAKLSVARIPASWLSGCEALA